MSLGMPSQSNDRMETDLKGHTRNKKHLHPPLKRLEGMVLASWSNDRLPELLWAVLAIGNWERDKALNFFRYVGHYVEAHHDCYDITLSGIGRLPPETRAALIKHICAWSTDTPNLLRPLLLFPNLPGRKEWEANLPPSDSEKNANELAEGIVRTLWHQSEEATDCRWVRLLCMVNGDKMKFSRDIDGIDDTPRGLKEYPNFGDLKHIRPFIRATEMATSMPTEGDHSWSDHFWDVCFRQTSCIPESHHTEVDYDPGEWDKRRKHLLEETARVRKAVITHCFDTATTTALDPRHEGVFGLVLYGQELLDEMVLQRMDYSVTGRLSLRAIMETYVSLAYLLIKDDSSLWAAYREHGLGQAKLVHLKLDELQSAPPFIDPKRVEMIANEDKWQEYLSINLGHWDDSDLRKLSIEAGLKETYDRYYAWSSGYTHANWAAVRDTSFEKCLNPLHRLHRIPALGIQKLPDVVADAIEMTNKMLDLLSTAYPSFPDRVKLTAREEELGEIKP